MKPRLRDNIPVIAASKNAETSVPLRSVGLLDVLAFAFLPIDLLFLAI